MLGRVRPLFYREKDGRDQVLAAIPSHPGWLLTYPFYSWHDVDLFDPAYDAWWEVVADGDLLRGTEKLRGKARGTIELRYVAADCEKTFEERRLGLPRTLVEREVLGDFVLRHLRHPVTKVELVVVESGIPAAAAQKINAVLEADAALYDEMATNCDEEWEAQISASFLSTTWLVFAVADGGFCGGAHPNESLFRRSFDAKTGDQLEISFGEPGAKSVDGAYRELLRKRMTEEDEDARCADHLEETGWDRWQVREWLDAFGVEVDIEENDRADIDCERTMTFAFEEMRPFVSAENLARYDALVAAVGPSVPPPP